MTDDRPGRPEPLEVEADGVPEYLREREVWLVWRYDYLDDREEWSKVPRDGAGGGYRIDATDPANGVGFDVALETYESGEYDGLGIITDPDDLLVALDVDDCRNPERPHNSVPTVVLELLETLDTYVEVSPSGTGYHAFALGAKPDGRTREDLPCAPVLEDTPHLEMYDGSGGRYLTVTGQHLAGTSTTIETRPQQIKSVFEEFIAEDDVEDDQDAAVSAPSEPVDLDDQELVEKAKSASNGDEFRRLWNGDTSMHSGDHSRADLALCGHLAFWTGGDRARIDRLFRDSGLYRDKWDRDDYRERTVDKALEGRTDFYDPNSGSRSPQATATDGSGAVAADTPDARTDVGGDTLSPSTLGVYAGLGEDESVADLTDREKAAFIWELIKESDSVHIRVSRENGELWAFDPDTGIWNDDGERALRHAARKALSPLGGAASSYGGNVLEELKAHVRADPMAEVYGDEFGLEAGKVAVKNGLLDLEKAATGEPDAVRELEPDDYALTRLSVEYDRDADGTEWGSFVDDVVEDDMIDAVQEYIGYCLHRESTFDRALFLVGGGANGKSTFLNVVEELLDGEDHTDNTANISPYDFGDKPSMAELHGTLANISADLSGGSLQGKNLGNFKKLTGGDTVTAKKLYKDPFKFTYDGGMLFAANEVPDVPVSDDDAAFWRRWIIVHFDNYFPEGSDKRDPMLEGRLKEPSSLSAVLNWAIAGWERLLENGEFTNVPTTPDETRRKWQKWGDSVDEFLSDAVVRDTDAPSITTHEAYEVYRAWCRVYDRDIDVGQQKFTVAVKNSETDVGYSTSVRTKRHTTPRAGYKFFGTEDGFGDPLDVLEALEKEDDDSDDDQDGDGTRSVGLESFDDETPTSEPGSAEKSDVDTDDTDDQDGDDVDDAGADGETLQGKQLGPYIVQYVREEQRGRDGVPRDELEASLRDRGAAEMQIDHWIDKCLERGDIGEPTENTFTA